MKIMDVTNVLFIKNNKVLLGYKKRGFGKRKYNGFGGKLKIGETIEMAAVREAREEAGLIMKKYYKAGEIDFAESYPLRMHLYVCTEWDGEIIESDEMMPTWFKFDEVPLDEMWDDDRYWFHLAVGGQKFRASFVFENDDDISGTSTNNVVSYSIKLVDTLD